jgi:hypothetical protein
LYLCKDDPEDSFLDILNQASFSEPDETFITWLDILKYPETKYDLSIGELLVERWKKADQSNAARWTTELTNCAIIMAALLSNSVQHNGRALGPTSEMLGQINQYSANLADKALMLTYLDSLGKTVLGTSFHSVLAGDFLVLLEGAEWPVVLRQTGSKWLFIGPAYVTGIMDGEVWSDESGKVPGLSTFILV